MTHRSPSRLTTTSLLRYSYTNRQITRNDFEFITPTLLPHSENKWTREDDVSIRHGYK